LPSQHLAGDGWSLLWCWIPGVPVVVLLSHLYTESVLGNFPTTCINKRHTLSSWYFVEWAREGQRWYWGMYMFTPTYPYPWRQMSSGVSLQTLVLPNAGYLGDN